MAVASGHLLLGRGGIAEVYLDGPAAVKTMRKALLVALRAVRSVRQEKEALGAASESPAPFIAKLLSTSQDDQYIYLRMEAVLATPTAVVQLRQLMTSHGSLPPVPTARLLLCLLAAADHLHSRQIAHRDLKPENIVLTADGQPRVVDFGSARLLASGTRASTLCGTLAYQAPEMIGRQGHGCAVDLWALGVMLHEMRAGSTPFTACSAAAERANILAAAESGSADASAGGGPRTWQALVGSLLVREDVRPCARVASAHAWLEETQGAGSSPDAAAGRSVGVSRECARGDAPAAWPGAGPSAREWLAAAVGAVAAAMAVEGVDESSQSDEEERAWALAEREDLIASAEARHERWHREFDDW